MIVIWGFLKSTNPYNPGPPWIVLDSIGTEYICGADVLNSTGTTYTVDATVLASDGSAYNPI